MIWGGYEPTPPRPGSLDDCQSRGFDPDTARLPDNTEPLSPEWQDALDRSLQMVRHRRDPDLVDDHCGERCDRCGERVCNINGPELAKTCPAHFECVSCEADNPCRDCMEARRAA